MLKRSKLRDLHGITRCTDIDTPPGFFTMNPSSPPLLLWTRSSLSAKCFVLRYLRPTSCWTTVQYQVSALETTGLAMNCTERNFPKKNPLFQLILIRSLSVRLNGKTSSEQNCWGSVQESRTFCLWPFSFCKPSNYRQTYNASHCWQGDDDDFLWSVEDDLRLQNQVPDYWMAAIYFSACGERKAISNLLTNARVRACVHA